MAWNCTSCGSTMCSAGKDAGTTGSRARSLEPSAARTVTAGGVAQPALM